jgi:hypothetical protein
LFVLFRRGLLDRSACNQKSNWKVPPAEEARPCR